MELESTHQVHQAAKLALLFFYHPVSNSQSFLNSKQYKSHAIIRMPKKDFLI